MKKIRQFKCGSCQRVYEELTDDDVQVINCVCKKKAVRQLAMPKFLGNSCGKNASVR